MATKLNERIRKVVGIIHDLRKELEQHKRRSFVNLIVDCFGSLGIVFTAIQEYEAHGKYMYPLTHKYYKDLVFYLNYCLKDNMKRRLESNRVICPTKAMKRYQQGKAQASQEAQDWQLDFENHNYDYADLARFNDHFYKLGKRYGLLKEFRENGIL